MCLPKKKKGPKDYNNIQNLNYYKNTHKLNIKMNGLNQSHKVALQHGQTAQICNHVVLSWQAIWPIMPRQHHLMI